MESHFKKEIKNVFSFERSIKGGVKNDPQSPPNSEDFLTRLLMQEGIHLQERKERKKEKTKEVKMTLKRKEEGTKRNRESEKREDSAE
jgi:hypothetical protein